MFRSSLAAIIILLALVARGLCDTISVDVRLPDDADFRKYSFAYLTISGSDLIDSVSSALVPDKFDVDKSSVPNRIVFKPDLPDGTHSVRVTVGAATHQLSLRVTRLSLSVIDNAVFFTGPTSSISSLIARLKTTHRVLVVSQLQPHADTTEAAMLIPKSSAYLPLWEAQELVKKEADSISGVQVMPDRCPAASAQLCRSRLTFSSSRTSVHPAVVQLNSDTNFLGFGLSWVTQTAEKMNAEPCGTATCLNEGVCDANFTGVGFRCICPPDSYIPWGPRCEYPTRSYYHRAGDPGLAFTRLWVGGLPHTSQSLEISFEISGTVTRGSQETFVLKSVQSTSSSSVLSASFVFKEAELRVTGSLLGGNTINVGAAQLNSGSWFTVYILITPTLSQVAICPKNLPTAQTIQTPLDCSSHGINAGTSINNFTNFWLEIGKAFTGCVQSVTVNGYLVDMAAGRDQMSGAAKVESFCGHQNDTCSSNNKSYVCGAQSVCYGVVKPDGVNPMDCNCQCLGSKRKNMETVTSSGLCRKDNIDTNACTKDPLIISTKSSNVSGWFLNPKNPLPVQEKNSASIEMELRTRVNESSGVLNAVIKNAAGSNVVVQSLDISDGFMKLCVDSSSCFAFPPIRVDDGEWHSVFAATRLTLLKLTIDGVSKMHDLGRAVTGFATLDLTAKIANSLLRNIRVSGTYMSTTTNETDRSNDVAMSGKYVSPVLANDSSVGSDGVNPAPPCNCPSTESCRRLWGKTTCECPAGQERDPRNNCAAVNPCTKFNISCPSGGSCQSKGDEPGFECLCPPGVISRMCRVGGEGTPGPATAAVQWWVWLIVVIVAFMIIILILLGFIMRSRRRDGAGAPKEDIEKINQDMGDDSGNDGVPPEDYNGPLSLNFPAAPKDSNGGLPNFQPVQTAAPPEAGSPAETQRPVGAPPTQPVAPDSVDQEPSDAAAGDETLNYGYEDTRDDDAADLDQVSLVSADTDFSIDLRPTLDSWGPKFQPLSDILT